MDKVTVRRRSPDPKRQAQDGDPWQGDFSFELEGKRRRVRRNLDISPTATEKQALAAAKAMQAQVRREAEPANAVHKIRQTAAAAGIELPRPNTAPVAFSGLADLYLQEIRLTRKTSTVWSREYQITKWLIPWLGDTNLRDLTPDAVRAWQGKLLAEGKSTSFVVDMTRVVGAIWRFGQKRGHLQTDPPTKALDKLRVTKVEMTWYEGPQMTLVLDWLRDNAPDYIHRLFVTLFRTGLRRGEALSLRACDVSVGDPPTLCVARTYHQRTDEYLIPKNNKTRTIPLHPEARDAILAQRQARGLLPTSKELLWEGRSPGRPVGEATLHHYLERAALACGLPHLRVHGTRHSFAGQLASRGVSMRILAELLGQSTLSVTELYAHISEGSTRNALTLLPPQERPLPALLKGGASG